MGIKTISCANAISFELMEYSDCKKVRKLMDEEILQLDHYAENCTYQFSLPHRKEQFEKS